MKDTEVRGLIFDIRRFCVHDGPGIRTTVFFKGCPMGCAWCHNPESRLAKPETSVRVLSLDGNTYNETETTGLWMSVDEVLKEVEKDRVFYEESGGGISISGGEPLFQPEFLLRLLPVLKQSGFHIALDTCGHAGWEILEKTLKYVNLYLYDLKIMDNRLHRLHTGRSNRLILGNLLRLAGQTDQIVIRIPVVPGINDSDENFGRIRSFLHQIRDSVKEIGLLPYHSMAESKYKRMGKEYALRSLPDLHVDSLEIKKKEFEAEGYVVKVGR